MIGSEKFRAALTHTLKEERGFVNDPADTGGPTKYGITHQTLSRWRGHPVTLTDVQTLELEEAAQIYHAWYWKPVGCDRIQNQPAAIAIFDAGVLFGIPATIRAVQESLRTLGVVLTVDGIMGPLTLKALNELQNPHAFLAVFRGILHSRAERIVAVQPQKSKFLGGWRSRINRWQAPPYSIGTA